jgi:predicted MFS family arabinose efflux permease
MEFWVMGAIAFLIFYSNYMVAPLMPAFFREFAVGADGLRWLLPGFSLAYGFSTLVYGLLSDRVGRIPVLLILLPVASLTILLSSFATNIRELVALRILSGIGTGGIVTISLASVGDRFPYIVQGRAMGKIFGAVAAGMGMGSSFGPILNPIIGWRNEFRVIAAGLALTAIFLWFCSRSSTAKNHNTFSPGRKTLLEYLNIFVSERGQRTILFIFFNGIFHGGIFSGLGLLIASRYHLDDIGIGIVLAGYGIPDLILGGMIGALGDKYGRRYVVPLGFLWAGLCALLIRLPVLPAIAALIVASLSIAFEATHPLMSSIATSLNSKHRGQITGLATFTKFCGMGIGALIFQNLLKNGFSRALFVFGSMQILIGIAASYAFRDEQPTIPMALVRICGP